MTTAMVTRKFDSPHLPVLCWWKKTWRPLHRQKYSVPLRVWSSWKSVWNFQKGHALKMIDQDSHYHFVIKMLRSASEWGEWRPPGRIHLVSRDFTKLTAQKATKWGNAPGPGILHIIKTNQLEHCSCLTYRNVSSQSLVLNSVTTTIVVYMIIPALHISDSEIFLMSHRGNATLCPMLGSSLDICQFKMTIENHKWRKCQILSYIGST